MMRLCALIFACTCLVAIGCGPDGGDDAPDCEGAFLTGDLIITEVMANPTGDDSGQEWFEVYNATDAQADLTGLVLVASREDMTDEKTHRMTEVVVDAGDYLVVGGVLPEFTPPHVDYGYANELGALRNSAGRIALRCQGRELDAIIYGAMSDGVAQGFDGAQAPNHTANDNLDNWCAATVEYATGNYGSPGMANEACSTIVPTTCNDNGTERDVVSPVVGDLVINEFLANYAGADDNKEWFEVYVTRDVDLNGLQMGRAIGDVEDGLADTNCLRVTAGSYLVFAQSMDPLANGGLPRVDFVFDFSANLGNASGSLFIGISDTILDSITWTNAPEGSRNLDPSKQNATDNDDTNNWCNTVATYGDGENGTPGEANETCPIIVPPGMCDDGGVLRAIMPPLAADVTITEFLSDPGGSGGDATREWFEVYFAADADLNGLQLGKVFDPALTVLETITQPECLRVTAGTYAIFAHETESSLNGMLPFVTATFNFALNQDNSGIFVAHGDALLDGYAYGTTQDGTALSRDDTGTWCDAVTAWAGGDLGTPGMMNPLCM